MALEFQGLTGLAEVSLAGGAPTRARSLADGRRTADASTPTPIAGADVTQAARNVLARVDGLVAENEEAMRASMRNIRDGDGDAGQELAAAR